MSRKDKGLTLVEVLVVLAILSILVAMLYTVFKSGADAWTKSEARLDIYQNARVVLDQMTRELAGAFAGGTAQFTGSNANPDTLEFMTDFGGNIYKVKYELASGNVNVLERKYIKNPPDYANIDYANAVNEDDGIEEGIIQFGFKISDINLQYLPVDAADWSMAEVARSGATLPEAVKVELKLKEKPDDTEEYPFETIVYLPNSE